MRDHIQDFLLPALKGLNKKEAKRVSIAMDAAIAFGVLEYVDGNESLRDIEAVKAKYLDNVTRLHA